MKKHIPNIITCLNLLSGCIAIVYILESNVEMVMVFVYIALIADFLDGFVARLLKVSSGIGGELDSLADVITFGVLPGMAMYRLLSDLVMMSKMNSLGDWQGFMNLAPYFAFLIPILSAVRLAKFNLDDSQTDYFKGLPTPANAIFILSLYSLQPVFELRIEFVLFTILFFSLLLVSNVRLIALKFKSKSIGDNLEKIVLLLVGVFCILYFGYSTAFLVIIPVYIALSILYYKFKTSLLKKTGSEI